MIRRSVIAALALLALVGCGPTTQVVKPQQPAAVAAEYPADLHGAKLYRLAADQSTLHILAYRGGSMAQLGHNHVISSQTLSGYVWLHDSLTRSGFNIVMPVNDLVVDDPQMRSAEGADFTANVTDAARDGTHANMLKPEQLDGEHYPFIRLQSMSIEGSREQPTVTMSITIKEQTHELMTPVRLTIGDQALKAVGEFHLKQSDFGIKPYSVAMGALQVQDELTIKFELVAVPM